MAYSKAALKQAQTAFNRVAGQYRRYYNINPESYIEGATTPRDYEKALEALRYDLEREKIAAEIAEYEARLEADRARKEFEAQLSIENFKQTIRTIPYQAAISTGAQLAEERTAEVIITIIDRAVSIHGYIDTWERLQPYAAATDLRIERLIVAIYSKIYNTNTHFGIRDEPGDTGRAVFERDMEQFAADLGVTAGEIIKSITEDW